MIVLPQNQSLDDVFISSNRKIIFPDTISIERRAKIVQVFERTATGSRSAIVYRKCWKSYRGQVGLRKVRVKDWNEPPSPWRQLDHSNPDDVKKIKALGKETTDPLWLHFVKWRNASGHKHVAPLLGLAIQPKQVSIPCPITLEYSNGNINAYLERNGRTAFEALKLVASALEFMHGQASPIVHHNLRGSNILITDDGDAHLTDIGLCQWYECAYAKATCRKPEAYEDKIQSQWWAPEVVRQDESRNAPECDIWSFGMTMQEVLTGDIPYPEFKNRSLPAFIKAAFVEPEGKLPTRPEDCFLVSDDTWELMLLCWASCPADRPSMLDVRDRLEKMICPSQESVTPQSIDWDCCPPDYYPV